MNTEILIAGGGLAGSAAGCILAAAGRNVSIIEREAGPTHKICGEFLSTEAQTYLEQIGFDVATLSPHPISRLRVTRGFDTIETKLPFLGIGLSRYALDEALLSHAASLGAKVSRGYTVTSVTAGLSVQLSGGDSKTPNALFLATGKHDVRGLRRPDNSPEDLVGFKMHFRLQPRATAELRHFVSLILFRDGYAGIQLIEHERANLCLLVRRDRFTNLGGKWPNLLADLCTENPYLMRLLDDAEQLMPQPLTIYRVPYGYVHRPLASHPQAVFRLGDQAAVIPSFTGDGMSIAMHTARLASATLLRGGTAHDYHRQLAIDVSSQIRRASLLYNLAYHRKTQAVFFQSIKTLPKILTVAAKLTRIPKRARLAVL